jgi:hypothetical protein
MDMGFGMLRKAKIDAYFMTKYKKRTLKTKKITMEENGPPINFN